MIFGNLGQDDIIGGSSSFFGLPPATCGPTPATSSSVVQARPPTATTWGAPSAGAWHGRRPRARRRHGRGRQRRGRPPRRRHRLPTTTCPAPTTTASTSPTRPKLVVRAVTLLDYTPGGPDYQAAASGCDPATSDVATTRCTVRPATTRSTWVPATTSRSATPVTTTSSADGATTGPPAAPAPTACSATTAASSPAATASQPLIGLAHGTDEARHQHPRQDPDRHPLRAPC